MTHNTKITLLAGSLMIALGVLPASAAFAHSEGINTQTEITNNTTGKLSGTAEAQSGRAEPTSVSGSTTVDTENEDANDVNDMTDIHAQLDAFNDVNDVIELDHDTAAHATATAMSVKEVTNRGQLRSFLNHVIKGDDRVADVRVSSTTVETHYSMPAKFLWTIPTNLSAEVTIANDGSVTIKYPWYAFLYSKNTELKSEILAAASSTSATGTTTVSANLQAKLLNALFTTLKGSK